MTNPEVIDRVRSLQAHLLSRLRGQDAVLTRLAEGFGRAALALSDSGRPAASFLLAGPTGVGKSQSFLSASDHTFGPGRLAIFDMSEYQDKSAVNKLLGDNRTDAGLLGLALSSSHPRALLFDEIEKAHPLVLDVFLQILWRGCVTVATGQVFRFGGCVIGFTSNIGAAEAVRMEYSSQASIEQATMRRLERSLRSEFLGRIGDHLIFSRLGPDAQRAICAQTVETEIRRLSGQGYDLRVTPEALEFLVQRGFSPVFGARGLDMVVEQQLQNAILHAALGQRKGSGRLTVEQLASRLQLVD